MFFQNNTKTNWLRAIEYACLCVCERERIKNMDRQFQTDFMVIYVFNQNNRKSKQNFRLSCKKESKVRLTPNIKKNST